ncbi:unnamed protein product [Orchesella dallaii]|uniref:Methyltransferase FkbM domain-containing protein n=1 Tax=Orchesella dallaii TaxID=48710 RepID=A0ABP1RIN4_9HEXA
MTYVSCKKVQRGTILVGELVLFLLGNYLIYSTIRLINENWYYLPGHTETDLDFSSMEYDDLGLLRFIKQNYLNDPADLELERNLTKTVWKGPVTELVLKLLHNKSNGFFIEAGANDGEFLSNSLPLEVYHDWSGLLVEADPAPLQRLLSKRRKAWVAGCCLSPFNNSVKINMVTHKEWNGIGNIPSLFKGVVKKGDFSDPFEVQCFPLYSLLLAIGRTEVDYLSLDIEGAEYEVLKTIPFDKVSINIISVEFNKKSRDIIKLLHKHGYKSVKRIRQPYIDDLIFINPKILKTLRPGQFTVSHH